MSAIVDSVNISRDPNWNRFEILLTQSQDICEIVMYGADCSKKRYYHSRIFLKTARTDVREHIFCYPYGHEISTDTVFVFDAHGQNGIPLSHWDPNASLLADTQTPEHEWPNHWENPVTVESRRIEVMRAKKIATG